MRPLAEVRERWRETVKHGDAVADLKRAVRYNGESSPCVSGCRSVCWKAFLLLRDAPPSSADWVGILAESRAQYADRRDHLLKFIKHPELLTELAVDPLADDPDSPWNTVREDEVIRGEIAQDVRRLPDEPPFYHEERIQALIVDVLFVYCKLNPKAGGYRQGMHELLAPIVYVVDQDAVDRSDPDLDQATDALMATVLDSAFVEHDAFVLFSKVMDRAQAFYEVNDSINKSAFAATGNEQSSSIVEKSKYIHDVCLAKVDPELASHLKNVEILPQIFLIRWIRLLFGREFPFDQFLVLWDTIFAVDPTLELIDLICVAMLIRIRWSLLEADYSVCLQLLLKYPSPGTIHGPHTFVDDAVYLRSHLSSPGGSSLILKYSGKLPSTPSSASSSRPSTPSFQGLGLRQRTISARSPLPSPSKFIQQQGGVEAIFQGAAKKVLERGEHLGINQAVRDAVGEIKRNVQGFQEARLSPRAAKDSLASDPRSSSSPSSSRALAAIERRNRQLAGMLDETVVSLRTLATSGDLENRVKTLELIEIAAARVQFVRVYLEDPSMVIPDEPISAGSISEESEVRQEEQGTTTAPGQDLSMTSPKSAAEVDATEGISNLSITGSPAAKPRGSTSHPGLISPDAMDTSNDVSASALESKAPKPLPTTPSPAPAPVLAEAPEPPAPAPAPPPKRPRAPIPTRSTLAQSSFSWMLEPDVSASSSPPKPPAFPSASSHASSSSHRKRPSGNAASRERNAFLFGEVTAEADDGGRRPISTDEIFGLEPIRKPTGSSK